MENEKNIDQAISFEKKKWHKTKQGKVFLGIILFFVVLVVLFSSLVGYYAWQIKYGSEDMQKKDNQEVLNKEISLNYFEKIDDFEKYIKKYNPVSGKDGVPVTVVTFLDFQCSFCQETYSDFKKIQEKYPTVLRVVFKHLPLIGLQSGMPTALASACAQEQDMFWEYYNVLFSNPTQNADDLILIAESLGMDKKKFNLCLSDEKYRDNIENDIFDAVELNLKGTPTYIVNGYKIEGVLSEDQWDKIILESLQK